MNEKQARGYWIVLSAVFAACLAVVGLLQGPAMWVIVIGLVALIVGISYYFKQIRKDIFRKFSTAAPVLGILASVFSVLAVMLRGSAESVWAVPVLSVISFIVIWGYLEKFGKIAPPADGRANHASGSI